MALSRYSYQFNASFKPKMAQIEGFVSIGTGGQVNFPDQSGLGAPSGLSVSTGPPRGLLPGQATPGVPTGWQGGFSGVIGLLGAGVKGIQRVQTGVMAIQLEEDWARCDSVQVSIFNNGTGIDPMVLENTVGQGNTIATGGLTGPLSAGNNLKNVIFIKFLSPQSIPQDLDKSAGFYLDIRLRDSLVGNQ